LVTGASGTLGRAFTQLCAARGLRVRAYSRAELDICDADSIARVLNETAAWAVINTAGYVRVDDAEFDSERCFRENSAGAELLASACADRGLPFLTFSSDLVFDGQRQTPYVETHDVQPLNVYGLSKARAERAVMQAHDGALIVRTSSFFGPWDDHNFVTVALRTLARGDVFRAIDDIVVSPTYVPDLVNAALDLLIDGEQGLWHLVNDGSLSWAELVRRVAKLAKVSTAQLQSDSWRTFGLAAARPSFSVLTSQRGIVMPALEDALARYVAAL
jgi:dTDP-4-dehydrorhamnose reductase